MTGRGRSRSGFLDRVARLRKVCERVIVLGTSFGAEAALVNGVLSDHVDAVVAFAPSDVVWAGLTEDGRVASHWTYQGAPLPFVQFADDWEPADDPPAYVDLTVAPEPDSPTRWPRRRSLSSASPRWFWWPGEMTRSRLL